MKIRSIIGVALAALAVAVALPAMAQGTGETIKPNFDRVIPNMPGKS